MKTNKATRAKLAKAIVQRTEGGEMECISAPTPSPLARNDRIFKNGEVARLRKAPTEQQRVAGETSRTTSLRNTILNFHRQKLSNAEIAQRTFSGKHFDEEWTVKGGRGTWEKKPSVGLLSWTRYVCKVVSEAEQGG